MKIRIGFRIWVGFRVRSRVVVKVGRHVWVDVRMSLRIVIVGIGQG